MSDLLPTVFLRLEGPLQSWGTTSRHGVRATDDLPSKSGVIGIICSALGLRRGQVGPWLKKLSLLKMGVRVDRPGRVLMDYHTAGAKIGLMSAQGKIKVTQTTGEKEVQVSRRYYLADASFLVVLQGQDDMIHEVASRLQDPVWPPFLGRKSCPPSMPVYEDTGEFPGLAEALAFPLCKPRIKGESFDGETARLRGFVEKEVPDHSSFRVSDVPLTFSPPTYGFRFVAETEIPTTIGPESQPYVPDWHPHTKPNAHWDAIMTERKEKDRYLCVFCWSEAKHVHHVTYKNSPFEQLEDLRSVCELCHDALTMIEYSEGRTQERLDPCDPKMRTRIIAVREQILSDSVPLRIRRRGD